MCKKNQNKEEKLHKTIFGRLTMEKLTMSNAFQKSIDNLKNTECSQKEKIGHFLQIVECLQSPTLRSNSNYLTYLSAGMSTLLLFCEDTDSVTRMSAEENLNKIIRFCENGNIVRVQVELYHEIKKNGNERSLRICLNLFSYYCHLIKQRKARSYAQNLLPCIYAISRRTETLLLETLAEFLKTFCKYLQNCMTDNETSKLIEIFLEDLKSNCAVKRRCSAQNVITLIESSVKPEQFSQFALTTALDFLIKDQSLNTILGIMGFLRIILPIILKSEKCDYFKIIEIYELCLQYLNEKNHSIINASLEVVNVILVNSDQNLKNILREYDTKEILLKKKTLKNLIFHISPGASMESQKHSRKSSVDEKKEHTNQHLKVDDRIMNLSDAELESLKSMDFDTEIELINKKTDENKPATTISNLKPQKSIESFGSFINSILPSTNTDSVSKFLRSQLISESPVKVQTSTFYDEDNLSMDSMNNSFVSMQSLPYDSQSESLTTLREEPEVISTIPLTPEIKIIDQSQSIIEQSIRDASLIDCRRDITIGSILDQSILEYTVRLVCSRFLLAGEKGELIGDHIVRVSIKNLSLLIISNCVAINPHLLLINLENDTANELENFDILLDDDDEEEEEEQANEIVSSTLNLNQAEYKSTNTDAIERDDNSENLLEIKDDHFGEATTKFLDLFATPLSRSVNESSIKSIHPPLQSNMSRSEIIYEKYKKDLTKMLTPLTLKSTKDLLMSAKNDGQKIYDVILFANHHDPILRGNTQNIISNFISAIMKQTNNKYLTHEIITVKLLNLNHLLKVVIKSFFDEIHTVVKQALFAFENIFPFLLRSKGVLPKETILVDHISNVNHTIDSDDVEISAKFILENLLLVFENKYWVVQCKYCEVIAGLNFGAIKNSLGDNYGASIEKQCLNHLMTLLKDSDIRVRNHVGSLLSTLITNQSSDHIDKCDLENTTIEDFISERIFNELPIPLNYVIKSNNSTLNSNKYLGKMLYILSNSMLEISDKNQQFGVINAIKELVVQFNPIFYNAIWNEYKILEVCLSYVHHNIVTGLDLTCQSDLLTICTNLICGSTYSFSKTNEYVKIYLTHLLKVLNIFDHLFMETKPLIIPKGQKADLFVGAKELQSLNKIGYFGNNHFYLKLFKILKSGYESYKITINKDSGSKIFELLKSTLYSLTVILELKVIDSITISIKLIEEILSYLTSIIVYIPKRSVICTKTLLKYLFGRNFQQRRQNYDFFLKKSFDLNDEDSVIELFEYVKEFYTYKPSDLAVGDTNGDLGSYIKIFESMVIYCLKLFTKSNSEIQAEILDMLCQLLEFKVNYCLLDANNVFIDFVLRHIDVIEAGSVRKCELLIPNIMKFLFHLSKQKDKKLITIPKIINITDNLLANNMIRNGSIKSLVELAYETFFIQKINSSGSQETEQLQIKDLNTQKEVVLSMLVKFLDCYEIRKITTVIITSIEPEKPIDENEIYQILLNMIQENKIVITDLDVLENINNLFESFKKNVLFDSKNMELSIKLFVNTLEQDSIGLHEIGIVVILLKNLIFKTDEIYIENHIKYFLKEKTNNLATPSTSSPNSYLINKFYNFLKLLIDKYEIDYGADNVNYSNFVNILFTNLKRIKSLKSLSKLLCDNFENDLKFVSKMFELNFTSILIEFLIEINYDYKNLFLLLNDEKFMEILDKDVRLKLIRKLDENHDFLDNIDQPTIEYIMQCNIDILFVDNSLFLLSLLTTPKHSNLVFEHIVNYYRKFPTNENLYSLLKLLEKSSINISLLIGKFLIGTIIYNTKGITLKKSVTLLLLKMMEIHLELLTGNDLEIYTDIISEIKSEKFMNIFNALNVDEKYENLHSDLMRKSLDDVNRMILVNLDEIKTTNATDDWFYEQLKYYCSKQGNLISPKYIVDMLNEIKSESKLITLLDQQEFNLNILPDIIKISFDNMINNFKIDCIQYNPHINYLKVSILLKNSLNLLYKNLCSLVLNESINFNSQQFLIKYNIIKQSIINFINKLTLLEETSLIFIEEKFIKKFIKDNLLKTSFYTLLLNYLKILLNHLKIILLRDNGANKNVNEMKGILICVRLILNDNNLWIELNTNSAYTDIIFESVNIIFLYLKNMLSATSFWRKYRCPDNFVEAYGRHKYLKIYSKAMFIAKFIEEHESIPIDAKQFAEIQKITLSIATAILRTNILYSFAITPLELFSNYNFTPLNENSGTATSNNEEIDFVTLPSIPIEYLNDVEMLEKFVKRINTFGFSSRQQFEELFMTLLVLANKESDFDMIDPQEQLYIKNMCLYAIVELLIACKTYPRIGKKDDNFFHATRLNKISMDTISLKKLHKIQLLIPNSNIFYRPNLERTFSYTDEKFDNIIGTNKFLLNQIGMNFIWQLVEENAVITNNSIKNSRYFIEELKIDIRSSLQLIYDVFSLCIDNDNYVLVLPHLIKLSEICEKREQFKWIKDTMLLLQEKVPLEDTISHQYIIYLLCKSYAVLVPSLSDLVHLCTIIPTYLKSTHIFIRNATLCGLLSLLECCVNSNTTIGSLSEELLLLRNLVINYIIRYGIIDESIIAFSDIHTKLVWTLNFYLIEKTSKFVTDCNLLSNTIISANNILKNTTNLEQYLCILYGLERIVITNTSNKIQREKIEKLVIDLIKLENEEFSMPALKLLVTCMYIGSSEQIENTEYANGIVQDEPEVIVQSIEKIELLFMKIKSTKSDAAKIFGDTLCQIVKDLVPPNEILTKVIKELLSLNQPHGGVIAKIVFQVFRSTIDSSFHTLLQDWLICSLPNFVGLPIQKSIWCLTIIFISSSINLNIVKIFPEILGKSTTKFDDRMIKIFYIASKDFYDKLNKEQKVRFSNIFKECEYYIYKNMLKCL